MLILALTVTGCVSVSTFASLVGILIGITSSAAAIKISAITEEIKKYRSILKKKKKHDQIVLLGKPKLNAIEVLISKALINLHISDNKTI